MQIKSVVRQHQWEDYRYNWNIKCVADYTNIPTTQQPVFAMLL